jgi:threonine/homoserine/homoserine lactone efflux protein
MIPSLPSLLLFLAGALVLLVIPGQAVFYILSRTVGTGRKAGVVSAAGIAVGTLLHVAAAILGLSALLPASAKAFSAVWCFLGCASSFAAMTRRSPVPKPGTASAAFSRRA